MGLFSKKDTQRLRRARKAAEREGGNLDSATTDLLADFRAGDATAFRKIVNGYEKRLVGFFYRLCFDKQEAEDLTQKVFMKLLGARSYRPERKSEGGSKLNSYIFKIATNLWIDRYRSDKSKPSVYSLNRPNFQQDDEGDQAGHVPAGGKAIPQLAIEDEEKQKLRDAIESLTPPHRLVFELAVYQQMPYKEISEQLNIPVGTVKSRMHNTVNYLKSVLTPDEQQEKDRATG